MNKMQHGSQDAPGARLRRLPRGSGPIAETVLLVLAAVVADRLLFAGTGGPFGQPLLLWVPVMLASAQHGVMGGIGAAALATTALFLVGVSPAAGVHDFYSYAAVLAGHPAGWVLYALTIGALSSQQKMELDELRDDLADAKAVNEGLADGFERALAEIARLELRIAADTATVLSLTRAIGRIHAGSRRELLASFADVVQASTGATALCVYGVSRSGFEVLACRGAGTDGETVSAPALSAKLAAAWRAKPRAIAAGGTEPADLLPRRAICAVPIAAADAVIGAILIVELPKEKSSATAIARVEHLAAAIGALARHLPEEVPT